MLGAARHSVGEGTSNNRSPWTTSSGWLSKHTTHLPQHFLHLKIVRNWFLWGSYTQNLTILSRGMPTHDRRSQLKANCCIRRSNAVQQDGSCLSWPALPKCDKTTRFTRWIFFLSTSRPRFASRTQRAKSYQALLHHPSNTHILPFLSWAFKSPQTYGRADNSSTRSWCHLTGTVGVL